MNATGEQWLVEAYACDPAALRDRARLESLLARMIEALGLHPVAAAQWHQFEAPGGLTGFVMLSESHVAIHTFPEHGSLCLDLFCCVPRGRWDFEHVLGEILGAARVRVRRIERRYAAERVVPEAATR